MATIPQVDVNTIEQISKVLGNAASGSELSNIFIQRNIDDVLGYGATKWRRIFQGLTQKQQIDKCGNNIVAFIQAVMSPVRFDEEQKFEELRMTINIKLAFCGMQLQKDGKITRVEPAGTITEAEKRANSLRYRLQYRNIHPEVMKYCKAELLQDNYFHAVFEATKGVAQRIRERTGLDLDGAELVQKVFSVNSPLLAFNTLRTEQERNDHKGFSNLLTGFFGAVRNPRAHVPKILWEGEEEAADYLTLASLLMRKIEQAIVVPYGGRIKSE
ncbi:MAG: TIGR02391 family protein [Sedimentisphaerales bacterium]|jgi:uncharacterized protein (TIGR02391 family)